MDHKLDNMGIWVTLSLTELLNAASVGVVRHHSSFMAGRRPAKGVVESGADQLGIHIEGACGEIAVAKVKNMYFAGTVDTFKNADLGKNVQVRTRKKHISELIVRPGDNPEHYFVLVTGSAPEFCVRGWIKGEDAMQERFLKNPGEHWNAAYFVPASELQTFAK